MKTKVINDMTYYVIKDDNDILSNMDISDKLTEYFDDFDYIVGDISYSVIRLKGFYRDSKSNNKFNKIHPHPYIGQQGPSRKPRFTNFLSVINVNVTSIIQPKNE